MSTTGRDGGEPERLAPVIPLFDQDPVDRRAAADDAAGPGRSTSWRTTWDDDAPAAVGDDDETASATPIAESLLLRRLRTRSLSVAEARSLLTEQGVSSEVADGIVETFQSRGYLDDTALAEQVVHVAVDRKGQGRQAVARALSARGIPRELVDSTLAELPDDDGDRALDYARGKARAMRDLPPEAALRRLAGQLARRGYGSSAALGAARTALEEARRS